MIKLFLRNLFIGALIALAVVVLIFWLLGLIVAPTRVHGADIYDNEGRSIGTIGESFPVKMDARDVRRG